MDNSWSWANLSEPQLEKLAEAERTLGVDYLLAFESGKGSAAQGALARAMTRGLPIAPDGNRPSRRMAAQPGRPIGSCGSRGQVPSHPSLDCCTWLCQAEGVQPTDMANSVRIIAPSVRVLRARRSHGQQLELGKPV